MFDVLLLLYFGREGCDFDLVVFMDHVVRNIFWEMLVKGEDLVGGVSNFEDEDKDDDEDEQT